ncbi:hypothetical protein ACWCQQ_45160, partial [Streptomyces sp. NPDC002143]
MGPCHRPLGSDELWPGTQRTHRRTHHRTHRRTCRRTPPDTPPDTDTLREGDVVSNESLANLLKEERRFAPPADLAADANVTAEAYEQAKAD